MVISSFIMSLLIDYLISRQSTQLSYERGGGKPTQRKDLVLFERAWLQGQAVHHPNSTAWVVLIYWGDREAGNWCSNDIVMYALPPEASKYENV